MTFFNFTRIFLDAHICCQKNNIPVIFNPECNNTFGGVYIKLIPSILVVKVSSSYF